MSPDDPVIRWLLAGDPAIRWQTMADLLGGGPAEAAAERARVATGGWGARLLRSKSTGLYTPKWTSDTYTLLLLCRLGLPGGNPRARAATLHLLDEGLYRDNGINLWQRWIKCSETCVTGMVLALAARFAPDDARLERLAAYLLGEQMSDGGWNCQRPRGATHSSLHTTINVLEGLLDYEAAGGRRAAEACAARARAHEFLFRHRMYRSHRTGAVIKPQMTRFSFPPHWYYDVLRGLDYLQAARAPRDERLKDAIALLESRRTRAGTWLLPAPHRGRYHFTMERPGAPSRWNTLRALRVLRWHERALLQ